MFVCCCCLVKCIILLAIYLIKTEEVVVDDTRGLLGCKFVLASAGIGVISRLAIGFCSTDNMWEQGSMISCTKSVFKVAATIENTTDCEKIILRQQTFLLNSVQFIRREQLQECCRLFYVGQVDYKRSFHTLNNVTSSCEWF